MLSVKRISWSGKSCVEMLNGYRYPKPVVGVKPNKKRNYEKMPSFEGYFHLKGLLMDKLKGAAQFYNDNLINRKFRLKAGKNKQEIEFDIVFAASNFKHLIGLNKLTDLPIISESSSAVNFRQILNNELTYADIASSKYFSEVEQRIEHFEDLNKALNGKDLMLKSQHGSFNTIIADFMLTNRDDNYGYAHLFLRNDDKKGFTVPVTYIINPDNAYLRTHAERWTVLSVEEVDRAEKTGNRTASQAASGEKTGKIEIEPLRIYKQTDKAVMVKLPGASAGDKKAVWLPKDGIMLDRERAKVVKVREDLQQKYSLKLPQGQPKRCLK